MDLPIYGQNPALALASAQVAAITPAGPPAPALGDAAGTDSSDGSKPKSQPMGFLALALQTQNQVDNAGGAGRPQRALVNLAFGDDGFGFDDVIDTINPLQHIPIISTIYRALTGDKIDVVPSLIGGALFGGVVGFFGAAVNAAVEDSTGHDIGDHVAMALFGEPDQTEREPVIFASADPSEPKPKDPAATVPWYQANAPAPPAATLAAVPSAAPVIGDAGDSDAPADATSALAPVKPLTPAQNALLQEREFDTAGQKPAAAPAGTIPELSPEQADLLLRSVGLKPAKPAAPPVTGSDAPPVNAPAVDAIRVDAVPDAADASGADDPGDDPARDSGVPPQAPVHTGTLKPSGQIGAEANSDFAQRMKYGLERYQAHPTALNPKPPHLDVVQ